ncbi:MAG: response regulator [Deltaproteobacteria bacterium]|nr:response regulator [Deltaproteobacteria bacterium]
MSEREPPAGAARLLVVDDNSANLQLLTGILREHGHLAYPASDGELALEFARSSPPDLVLLDIKMPGLDGQEVCRRLKADERTRSIPVIFISALESEGDRVGCFRAGGVDYVQKPFRPEEVLARVDTHLALRRAQLDLERRNAELAAAQRELEDRVRARTAELADTNANLEAEVAERRRAEVALSAARLFLDEVIGAVADPVFVKDRARRLVLVNHAFCKLAGRPRASLLGQGEEGAFPAAEAEGIRSRDEAVLASGRQATDEELLTCAGGEVRLFLTLRTLYRDERGEPFLVGVMRDITDYKRMQEQLLQSQKIETVGLLAGGVAHDFNNLLTPILSYTDLLIGELPGAHPWGEMLACIREAARSGQGLTQRLLAFSRKQRFELKPLDLGDLVRRFEGVLRRTLREDVVIAVEIAPGLGRVSADAVQLQQVLANLSVNAQDAMPAGGRLTIGVEEVMVDEELAARQDGLAPGPHVVLSVRDTGKGMDGHTMAHMFEPFFTTKELGKGTGLGLPSVLGIVKQHGGSISVASEPGRGSTFRVFLPRLAPAEAETAAPPAADPSEQVARGAETIVVAEDDSGVRTVTCRMLAGIGYRVLEASSPAACIELVRAHEGPLPLLISDVVMPGMNGRELYEALRRIRPDLKVLFMSGYPSHVVGNHQILEDGVSFIQKPFALRELAAHVRGVLDGKAARVAR